MPFYGSGFKHIYPSEHIPLSKFILEKDSLLLSEYSPNSIANTKNFPMRNRIISGISNSVLVVDASYRSGSSITANYAFKQNKNVFCIPHPLNSSHLGTNTLIQKGAILVNSPKDIFSLENIPFPISLGETTTISSLPPTLKKYTFIYQLLSSSPISLYTLLEKTKLSFNELSYILTLLEIQGYIHSLPGNHYKIKEDSYE